MLKRPHFLSLIITAGICISPAWAAAIRSVPGAPASLPKGDDVSSAAIPLGFSLNFLGRPNSSVYVNSNGNLTFGAPFVGYPGMPADNEAGGVVPPISSSTIQLVSGFLADIDTSAPAVGSITYGATTLNGRPAFAATFTDVTHFSWSATGFDTRRNSFQILLLDRGDTGAGNFDIELNYDKVEWETADSNGGVNGLGGYSAQAGYANGSLLSGTFFELPGSGIAGSFLNGAPLSLIAGSQNSGGVPGRYVFAIRNGVASAPAVSSISPATAQAGGAEFTLTVNGTNFAANSTVLWNGAALSTTFVNATQLTAPVAASRIATQGSFPVTVSTGGSSSNSVAFTVSAVAPPAISSLNPSTAQVGGGAFSLTVNGSGFAANSTVLWNGSPLATNFVNATRLTAAVGATLIAIQGPVTIAVNNSGTVSNGSAFTIGTATPVVSSLNPTVAQAGGAAFTLTVNGSGFAANSTILWNGAALTTTFGSSSQLTGAVAASRIAAQGSASITVSTNGVSSNAATFTIAPATPVISSLSPSTGQAGGQTFTLTVNGSGFAANSTILWNGGNLTTTFVNANQLTGSVGANLIAAQGAVTVAVSNSGVLSNNSTFTITQAPVNPAISSLNPSSAQAGGAGFTLTVNGSGFVAGSTVFWNGTPLSTTFGSASQLTATVAANLIASQGTVTVTVSANGLASNGSAFTIGAVNPVISNISPLSVQAGSAALTLTVNGSGFSPNSTILWNGGNLTTTFGSANQLTGSVGANLIATAGTVTVAVSTNGVTSNNSTFTITPATPGISSLNPSTAQAGGPTFTLTVNGSGFSANSTILWNGGNLATTFGSATQLTGSVGANLIASAGTVTVTVSTSGVVSNAATFTITAPNPTISSLSPASAQAGGGAFTLTVNGSGFMANSTVLWNGGALGTAFGSATQLTASVGANLIASPGTVQVAVSTNGVVSNSSTFTIAAGTPAISSLNPSSAPAGSATFTLTVNGSAFTSNSTILWNGGNLATTFVNATQLSGSVGANLITAPGTVTVGVNTNGAVSNSSTFTIAPGTPVLSSINPTSAQAGGPTFTLTVNGSGFAANSTILWNGTGLSTTFGSATQLTGFVGANLIASPGTATVTVSTNGLSSNSSTFTITPPTPVLSNMSPTTAQAGGATFTLTVNGSGFVPSSTILWNGGNLNTTYGSPSQLTGSVGANLITAPGTVTVAVSTAGLVSNSSTFTIATGNPTISSLIPTSAQAGGAAFTLTVNGSGFAANSRISWNGTPVSTIFVNANQLSGAVGANLITTAGSATITVSANGLPSNSSTFTISPAAVNPTISSLNPASAQAGGPAFPLTVNGSGFVDGSTIFWNGTPLSTTFGSASQLTGSVASALIAAEGTATITVGANGAMSNGSAFSITPLPAAIISSLNPSSAQAGGAAFTLTVNGSGFAANSTIAWNGTPLTTTFVNATQLTGSVAASRISAAGSAAITVSTNGAVSNTSTFTIGSVTPTLSSISPNTAQAGSAAFTLTVTGTGFTANSTILWNGGNLTTTFGSATQVTGSVGANLITEPGTVTVAVSTNGVATNSATFTIAAATPTISSLSPASAQAGGGTFILTVNGSGFAAGSTISWNGTPLSTSFTNANQLTAAVAASLIATQGTATVTASTNGLVSTGSTFTIMPATGNPAITSLSPSSALPGGPAFTLTVNGSGFSAGSTISWNGTPLPTTFGSAGQLTADVADSLIAAEGTASVTVSTNGTLSNTATFTIAPLTPAISSLSPSSAQAGGATFTLTVNGTGFSANSRISWGGTPLSTTFWDATKLTGSVDANLVATPGSVAITVSTNSVVSNTATFTIVPANAVPTISSLAPSSAQAGGAAFTLTVTGTGFTASSAISWNGTALPTTFGGATQLSGAVEAGLIETQGIATVTVTTNGAASNSSTFTISAPVPNPVISSLSPAAAQAGGAAFTLTVNGSGFAANSTILWNGTTLSTTFVNASQLTGSVAASLIAASGAATVTVSTNGNLSNSSTFTIAGLASTPTISSLSPATAQAGGPGFNLSVNGIGFSDSSAIMWNGTPLLTTFVNANQLKAPIAAALIASQGTASVTVSTGGTAIGGLDFVITAAAPAPTISSISPSSSPVGGPAFTLTVNGSGFLENGGILAAGTSILWNGNALPTVFVNASQLTANIDSTLLNAQGTVEISVSSGTNSVTFNVTGGPARQLTVFPTELNFTARAGGASPAAANLSVWSAGSPVQFHVAGSTGTWMQVSMLSGQTDEDVAVTANISGLTAGGYRGELTIQNAAKPSEVQSIPVTLTLLPATEPQLEVAPLNHTVEVTKGSLPTKNHLIVTNSTGGKLQFIGQTTGGDWLDLETTFGSALPSSPSSLTYILDPSGLNAGIYNGGIIVTDINSNQRLTAQITLIVSERRKSITVSQTAMEFNVTAQQPPSTKSFVIRNEGADAVAYSVESDTPGSQWLSTAPQPTSGTLPPGATAKVDVIVSPQGLAPNRYFGQIRIKAGPSGETVQTIPVILNVQDGSVQLSNRLSPSGVIIPVTSGTTATVRIQLSNPTANTVSYSAVPSIDWISVRPASGSIAPFQTLTMDVIARTNKVALGIHSHIVRILFGDGVVSTLSISAVVSVGGAAPSFTIGAVASCVPSSLAVVMTSLEQGFAVTSGGVATIQAKVLDSCGNPRPSSTLIARISSELNPIVLSREEEDVWTGSWVVGKPQPDVRVTVAAASTQGASTLTGQASIAGSIVGAPAGAAPLIDRATNAAGYQAGGQISPGSWVSIFGSQLADAQVVAGEKPYPTELGGTRVTLGGVRLPLLFVDPKQLNVFIPFQVAPNTLQQLIIERNGAISIPFNIKIADAIPGIYTLSQSGSGQGAAVLAGTQTLAAPSPLGRPVRRGETLEIYATGLGLVINPPTDGQTASTTTLSPTVDPVTVTIGGVPTTASFAGLTPGFVGLYQVNVTVPDDVHSSPSLPLTISISGKESNTVTIAVE